MALIHRLFAHRFARRQVIHKVKYTVASCRVKGYPSPYSYAKFYSIDIPYLGLRTLDPYIDRNIYGS